MDHHAPASPHHPSLLTLQFLLLLLVASACSYMPLDDNALRKIPAGGDDFDDQSGRLLAPLITSRVPGTAGHAKVQQHIVSFFQTDLPRWTMEWQNSTSRTPTTGTMDVGFENIIFRREPPWTKPGQANYLTLAAHYDSKSSPKGFVGAMDSAVPCAILMHVANSLDRFITQMQDEMAALGEGGTVPMDMGIQVVFIDGKEAFGPQPTDTDSLYGSRYEHILVSSLSFTDILTELSLPLGKRRPIPLCWERMAIPRS